jgi:N-acetylmuramic acid-specific PTS system IIC component
MNAWGGIDMGLNSIFGPSGILAIPMITSAKGIGMGILVYVLALFIGYASGFATGWLGYRIFKNNPKIN